MRWPDIEEKVAKYRRDGRRVVPADAVGILGYFAGPDIHLVDVMGLTDPLLARLPAAVPWRVGHYRRDVPAGYLESLVSGTNVIEDPQVRATWDQVALVTRAPVWSAARWRAMPALWGSMRP